MWHGVLAIAHNVEGLPCPTVFAAHAQLTASFELALACDIILAAEGARFGLVEAQVGITPGDGREPAPGRARRPRSRPELVMTGELFDAETMHAWGVVNRIYPAAQSIALHTSWQGLANGPTLAHAATKKIIRGYLDGGTAAADALVPETVGALFATEDTRDAVETFLSDGPGRARFSGR